MALFSVGIRAKARIAAAQTAFSGQPQKSYIVTADTAKKAENIVKAHLKNVGDDADVIGAVPAEMLTK